MSDWLIREAQKKDSAGIARLSNQLGYSAGESDIQPRLLRLLAGSENLVLVAESADGEVIGWIHGVLSQFLESELRVEIGGLVVDEKFRRRGIAREFLRRVESWANQNGARQISVRCRTTRTEAHRFYENFGFSAAKTQIAFRKSLR
jgi:GNAT superfamily N-acetyltransferase